MRSSQISNTSDRSRTPVKLKSKLRSDGYRRETKLSKSTRTLYGCLADFEKTLAQGSTLGHEAVRALVVSLEPGKEVDDRLQLDAIISTVAKSLKTFTGTRKTKELIGAMASKLQELNELNHFLKLESIPVAFDALRSHTTCSETHSFIKALLRQLEFRVRDKSNFNGWQIGMIMFGMRKHAEDDTTRGIIACLTHHLVGRSVRFSEVALRFVLLGLESHSPSETSHAFLDALVSQTFGHLEIVEMNTTVNALQGLRNHSRCMNALQILRMLQKKTSYTKGRGGNTKAAISGLIELQDYPCIPPTATLLEDFVKLLVENQRSAPSLEDICSMLAGLHEHPTTEHSRKLIKKLVGWLETMSVQANPAWLSGALWGLANQTSTPESRDFLRRVVLIPPSGQWTHQNVYQALSGLQNHAHSDEVAEVLRLFVARLKELPDVSADTCFSKEEYAAISSNMQEYSSKEAVTLLHAMVSKTYVYPLQMTPDLLGAMLIGLKMHGNSPESSDILKTLASHIQKCHVLLDEAAIGNALLSLQKMSFCEGSELMLKSLLPHIEQTCFELSADSIAQALMGLRQHAGKDVGKKMLKALLPSIEASTDSLSEQTFKMALCGLEERLSEDPSLKIFELLLEKIEYLHAEAISNAFAAFHPRLTWNSFSQVVHRLGERRQSKTSIVVLRCLHDELNQDSSFGREEILLIVDGLKGHGSSEASNDILKSVGVKLKAQLYSCDQIALSADDLVEVMSALHNHSSSAGSDELLRSLSIAMHVFKLKVDIWQLNRGCEACLRMKGSKGVKAIVNSMHKNLILESAPADQVEKATRIMTELSRPS